MFLRYSSTTVQNYLTSEWYTSKTGQLYFVSCFKSYKQEPYVMVKRSPHLPAFDERFVNYGKDKISWIEHLRYTGYKFAVLKNAYAIDIPHPPQCWLVTVRCSGVYMKEFVASLKRNGVNAAAMNVVYRKFKEDLSKTPDRSVVYFCDQSNNKVQVQSICPVLGFPFGYRTHHYGVICIGGFHIWVFSSPISPWNPNSILFARKQQIPYLL